MTDRPGVAQLRCSEVLVATLAGSGVRHAVLSPGSRSTPLALACLRHPSIETHITIDERSAAFLALGLARESGVPALVIATSGSAPGHWLPAVMEANHGAVPLLLLSADRPPELVGWGANQTTDQQHLFGGQVRAFHTVNTANDSEEGLRQVAQLARRAFQESRWPLPGPVHLNLPFREPLLPEGWPPVVQGEPLPPLPQPAPPPPDPDQMERLVSSLGSGPGVVVCGPGDRELPDPALLCRLAERLDAPMLVDPLSGLRFGSHDRSRLLVHY
ncbi:MAG TPA: 2-succinyl-5-enolpyruvyl-6-hydroxy-3-cyclohexene-1-carboxylic-acid synthase, partial [Thiotrichales bacterium]|nr:2-succinyl-5-enolpyruvyl-6-hydroxy-3-cyclohexene-1-carboxylic-acid synthase [Thiotrichales bacterium]